MKTIQNVAVFGASGQTGLCVLQEIVNSGLHARILQRDPAKVPDQFRSKVDIVEGNVIDFDAVDKTIQGSDAVIITLGTRNNLGPTTELSRGVSNIIASMKKHGVKTVSMCLSSFLLMADEEVPAIFHEINAEHSRMLKVMESEGSDINWIAVFPPHIVDKPRGKFLVAEGKRFEKRIVSKHDLAAFLLEALSQPEHFKKRMGISSV